MVRSNKLGIDYWPIFCVLGLLIFGIVMVYDASSAQALQSFNDKYFFLKEQIKWVVLGIGVAIGAYFFDYHRLKTLALPALVISIILLVAVFIPGLGVRAYGAHRWINLGFTVLQPSELAKLSLIIYLSTWLTVKERGRLPAFMLLISLLVGLIILEPDMGTAIVLLTSSLSIYFVAGGEVLGLIALVPVILLGGIGLAIKSPYRLRRITTFFDPESDPLGASYHIRQAIIAIGSGGVFGLGLGNSRQKYSYLPESMTDSIFAIISEELGLIGATVLLGFFVFFFYRSFKAILAVEDKFGKILGCGILFWLCSQTIVNIASMNALIPLTGVPLPLISYGGSALVTEMLGIGILFNIIYRSK
jgi:cell division protein FtsW